MKKISVYIPCYNAEKHIENCIKSLVEQTYPIDEIIIVDDGSTDNTIKIARKFPVKIIQHKKNEGLAAARNTAILNAKNELIASIDADCVASKDWLEKLVISIEEDEKIVGVGGKTIEMFNKKLSDRWRSIHMRQHWGEKKIINPKFLFGCNTLFRKNVLLEVSLFNEKFRTNYEDVDISKRIKRLNYILLYQPQAIAYHQRKDSLTSLLMTHWKWGFFGFAGEKPPINIKNILAKTYDNFFGTLEVLKSDIKRGDVSLIFVDLLILPHHLLQDIKWYLFYKGKWIC